MYCRQCGAPNAEDVRACVRCGAPLFYPPPPPSVTPLGYASPPTRVPNYLVQAILLTVFCCLPLGIVAIVYAAQVNTRLQMGDYAGAVEISNKARTWCWVAFLAGLLPMLAWFGLVVLGAMAG